MKILTSLMIFLITINSFAGDPTLLHKGDKAPVDGLLFSEQKAAEIHTQLIEGSQYKLLNDSLNKSISLYQDNDKVYDQKVQLLQTQNDSLAKSLADERASNFWRQSLFFLLGVAVTGLAVYGAAQIK